MTNHGRRRQKTHLIQPSQIILSKIKTGNSQNRNVSGIDINPIYTDLNIYSYSSQNLLQKVDNSALTPQQKQEIIDKKLKMID